MFYETDHGGAKGRLMSHGNEGSTRAIIASVIPPAWGDRVVIAVKARMRGMENQTGLQVVDAFNAVEARVLERFPAARWVFVEPDVR